MKKHPHKAFSLIEISVVILIIGILTAGISTGVDLFYDSRLATAQSLTKNSPVPRIEGLFTWIETTSPESFSSAPKDGASIGLIKDLSFKMDKANFVQTGEDGLKPIYKQQNLNNLPALYFDGSNDFLVTEKSYNSSIFSNSQITIFAVINYVGDTGTAVFLKHELANYRTGLEINGGIVRFDFPNSSKNAMGSSPSTPSIVNKNIIITAIANKSEQKLYVNSVLEANIVNSENINISNSSDAIYLGRNNNIMYFPTKFNFGELIIYDRALTAKELDLVTKYLSKKWAIKI
jgi:prepilin-type N-terminal cleavage/methylation domain-containing protein